MDTRRQFMSGLGLGVGAAAAYAVTNGATAQAAPPVGQPNRANVPTESGHSPFHSHVRRDEQQLKKLGGGDLEAGMNKLGAMGYQLMGVTSIMATGSAGFHIFKREPRPTPLHSHGRFTFRRLDHTRIAKMGRPDEPQHAFDDGLGKLEKAGWQIVAFTQDLKGSIGFYYFKKSLEG